MRTLRIIVAALFAMLATLGAQAAACDGFTDVDSGDTTFCSAVTYLRNKGVTLGCTGTTYCPNDYVTRLQMALFLQRMGRGGPNNVLHEYTDTIAGGDQNSTSPAPEGFGYNAIGGGFGNVANGYLSTVAGGSFNQATAPYAFVGGGTQNVASGGNSVAIGYLNTASSNFSTAIGFGNSAAADFSIVIGYEGQATAEAPGSIVFSDSTDAPGGALFGAGAPNLFVVGASGGILMFTNKDYSTSCKMNAGSGTWSCTSSKESKRDFTDIDRQDVLERVAALPVQRWRYKNEPADIRHIGTFAQDFHEAFGVGADDQSISMADADGVALAAIQALHARLKDKDAQIDALNHRVQAIEALLESR